MKMRKMINSYRVDSYRFSHRIFCLHAILPYTNCFPRLPLLKRGHLYFPSLSLVCHIFDCALVTCMGDTQWVKLTPHMQT